MDPSEPLLTTEDVANFLRVDVVTVRRLVSRSEIGAYRIGNEFRFSMSDVQAYLERQYNPAQPGRLDVISDPLIGSTEPLIVTVDELGFLKRLRSAFRGGKPAAATRAQPRGTLLDRFTKRAKRTLSYAFEEARSLQHPYVGTEHLLLALIRDEEGLAGLMLKQRGVQLDQARKAAEFIVGRGEASDEQAELELTASAKQAIQHAVEQSSKLGQGYIGTEHLLLGLIRKDESVAAGVAQILRVDLRSLRDDVLAAIRSGAEEAQATQPRTAVLDLERGFLEQLTAKPARKAGLLSKLTKLARSGLNASVQQARMLDKPYIGSDHILLGLLSIEDGLAAGVLGTLGVSYAAAREAATTLNATETVDIQPPPGETPMTTATQRMIEGAFDEARQLGHAYVGTEHLVLGMLRDETNAGCGVLKLLEVDFQRLRAGLTQPPA